MVRAPVGVNVSLQMTVLRSPFRRAAFLVFAVGVLVVAAGGYQWLDQPENAALSRTFSVPDYPWDQGLVRKSLLQIHRACKWTSEPPKDVKLFDPSRPVVTYDQLLSIDVSCAADKLAEPNARQTVSKLSLLLTLKTSDQLAFREALSKSTAMDWFAYTTPESGLQVYRTRIASEFARIGVPSPSAESVIDACLKREARWCIESNRITRLHIWSVIKSDWVLLIGTLLVALGLAGSVLLTPLLYVWRYTGARLLQWVKSGT